MDFLAVVNDKHFANAVLKVLIAASFIGATSQPNNPIGNFLLLIIFAFWSYGALCFSSLSAELAVCRILPDTVAPIVFRLNHRCGS